MTALPEMLTTAELAELLRVPIATIHQWRHKGSGPRGIRVGKHVRYTRDEVATWIQRQTEAPRSAA